MRRISAAERRHAWNATVIGSDKTGTLTKNEMTVKGIWAGGVFYELTGAGYSGSGEIVQEGSEVDAPSIAPLKQTLLAGALANEAEPAFLAGEDPSGDPTELALHVAAAKGDLNPLEIEEAFAQVDLLPFEPELRYMASLNETPDGRRLYVKGAPEVILDRCERQIGKEGAQELDAEAIRNAAGELARKGYRVLAMAYRDYDGDRADPEAAEAGLVFVGLQGMEDPVRPEAIDAVRDAHQAGIRVVMLTGDHKDTALAIGNQLGLDDEEEGAAEGREIDGLSDGELDALLKRINVFARVAPEHKMRIVQRLKEHKEVVAVTGDGVNDAPALRAAHLGIAMGKGGTDVAREASDIVLTDDNFATITSAIEEGRIVYSNIRKVTFFLLSTAVGEVIAITVAMTQMVMFQFFHVFNCRSLDRSIFAISPFSNRFLFVSIIAALAAHLAVLYVGPLQTIFQTVPLSLSDWGLIALVGSTVIVGGELDKWRNRRRARPLG